MSASITPEQLFDKISELLIERVDTVFGYLGISDLANTQKVINKDTGRITVGRTGVNDKLVLFQFDADAHKEDTEVLSQILSNPNVTPDTLSGASLEVLAGEPITLKISIAGQLYDISSIVNTDTNNPVNLGQFVDISRTRVNIDPIKLKTIVNTDIFELISETPSNQTKIDQFFKLWGQLKGSIPDFKFDVDNDDVMDTWETDLETHQDNYSSQWDISADNPMGGIPRLDKHGTGINTGKTLQSIHRELNLYLSDVLKPISSPVDDIRPQYENQSEGYLKFRHLNQGMIIRKQEGNYTGIEDLKNVTLNPLHRHSESDNIPSYLADGFTITMWVRFLDKSSTGTLFNYGNPTRSIDPKGFKLETYVLNKDDTLVTQPFNTWGDVASTNYSGGEPLFYNNTTERFIRLVVRDHLDTEDNLNGRVYDSHVGYPYNFERGLFVPEFEKTGKLNYTEGDETFLLTNVRIPLDFNEWFFIVASYDPTIQDESDYSDEYATDKLFWDGNINPESGFQTHRSGYGSKCKVEVISKTNLLRARGYKV